MSIRLRRRPARAGLVTVAVFVLSAGAAMAGVAPLRGKVVAVDKRTGRAAWEAPLWSRPDAAVMPLVTDDLIYVLEEGKTLKALNAATGQPRWQAPVTSTLPLTLVNDLVVAVAGNSAVAFNRWSGKRAWEFNLKLYPEWKFDENTIPVVAPTRLLLPARDTVIAIDPANGQPCWAYTVTAATQPLRPVIMHGMVYLRSGREESPVALKLEDGLPNTGEYALPPDVARAVARARKADRKRPAATPRTSSHATAVFVPVHAAVAPGGKALAAAGAKRWRFPAPAGWTIDRVAGESAEQLYALLETPGK
jgi:outer membrane protein assembly factor BamB